MRLSSVGVALSCIAVDAFYLPGVEPHDFNLGDAVDLKVMNLDSTVTQLPYDYYDLPFCAPQVVVEKSENLGEIISGARIQNSPYEISMNKIEYCKELCTMKYDKAQLEKFEKFVRDKYTVHWMIDNIPAATIYEVVADEQVTGLTAERGFALGMVANDVAYLNNHVRLVLEYHQPEDSDTFRIVGFEVVPYSIDYSKASCTDKSATPLAVTGLDSLSVKFSYDVVWKSSPVKWASRWDIFLTSINSEVHWFSITNSITLVLFLSALTATILVRALNRDFVRYNAFEELSDEEQLERDEDLGWKQVHGDVFRAPAHAGWLAVLVGTGTQICAMVVLLLMFACAGVLSPANRGALMTAFLVLFVFMGVPAGYAGARLHKMFGLEDWKRNAVRIASLFPGIAFGVFFILDLFLWYQHSSAAVPFGTLVVLLLLWWGVSTPLTMAGAYLGNRSPVAEPPTRVNHLARAIPEDQSWTAQSNFLVLGAGVIPFGAIFMEMFFIMTSVWQHQFYYMFGMLAVVFIVLVISSAEVSIFVIYNQLAQENYHWWWRAFFASGSSALYLMLYAVYYFYTELEIKTFVSGLLFFGYMSIAAAAFCLVTGTIGFMATLFFVRKIYATIKID